MGDFKKIETQEELDTIVAERIKKEKETFSKKYEGYVSPDDFQKKVSNYETTISELNKKMEEVNGKIAGYDKQIADKDKQIKTYETNSIKSRIAHETGLSYEAIEFLKGEDEESIKRSAESLKSLVGSSTTAPLASTEPILGNAADVALRNTLKGLKGE